MAKNKGAAGATEPTEKADTVKFRNGVSWAGVKEKGGEFSYIPGQIITLDAAVAQAREDAGLGEIVE